MDTKRTGAILLIVLGALGLAFGAIGFGRETHHASMGSIEVSISEERTVNIPVWAGVGAIVAGAILLLPLKKGNA